jgi:hypothetical protein
MYVNYFLLRNVERKKSPSTRRKYSPRFNSFDLSPVLQKPKLIPRPKKLPPLRALNTSMPTITQSSQTKPRKNSLNPSENSSSSEDIQPMLGPKFFN